MYSRSLLRSAALALAVTLSLGTPSAFAVGKTTPAAETAAAVLRKPVAQGLYELAYSPTVDVVYVASSGGFGDAAGPAQLLLLDPNTLDVEAQIPLERKAFGLVLDDANHRLYIGNTWTPRSPWWIPTPTRWWASCS